MGIQASLTGHLVFSTLHTNDAPSAITRLIDMGVPSYLVSSAIVAIMAIKVIFMETAFPARAADRILEETGVKTGILQPLETYDRPDQTYDSLMRENLAALKAALD